MLPVPRKVLLPKSLWRVTTRAKPVWTPISCCAAPEISSWHYTANIDTSRWSIGGVSLFSGLLYNKLIVQYGILLIIVNY